MCQEAVLPAVVNVLLALIYSITVLHVQLVSYLTSTQLLRSIDAFLVAQVAPSIQVVNVHHA